MKKRKFSIAILLLMTVCVAQAQKVTFYSPGFEEGVKVHIGLGENEDVLQTQTDTITRICLVWKSQIFAMQYICLSWKNLT